MTLFPWDSVPVILSLTLFLVQLGDTQLLINVRNQGGDVVQETIFANVSEDTVTLEFQRSDGTLITQLIDFTKDVQILKALVLGEEERGQSQYQVMCFVCHFHKGDFISTDAMAKLRQKNPGTVRTPEEDRGHENYTMDYFVDLSKSAVLSKHIAGMCSEASDATYTRHSDIELWGTLPGASESSLLRAVRKFPTVEPKLTNYIPVLPTDEDNLANCADVQDMLSPCRCHLELCIGWYPCGLKYCKGRGETKNSVMTYRCGIKTCKKNYLFTYFVAQKQMCLWDE